VKLDNPALLTTIFSLKRNFAPGVQPPSKVFAGGEIAPFKENAAAAVCISSDFEMSWAWRGRDPAAAERRGVTERQNVPFILELLDAYSIPITWATVGHLFLESCSRCGSGLAHSNMPRPKFNDRWDGDWYIHDPCSDVRKDPLWYAPDLIQQIMECRTPQEISTHSFSHINFSSHNSSPELVQAEIEACIEVMQRVGLRPQSLVFPHNICEYSYLQLLADLGIIVLRHRDDNVRLSYPERTSSGVYKIYESMNLRVAKHYDYASKAKIFIGKAMERRAAYSLWFHPSDPMEFFDIELRHILEYIDSQRSAGRLWVTTMRDLAAYCEARQQLDVTVERTNDTLDLRFHTLLDTSLYGSPEVTLIVDVPSHPKSAQLEMSNGERKTIDGRFVGRGSGDRLLVNVPGTANSLHFSF
jgi:hypothetical protein